MDDDHGDRRRSNQATRYRAMTPETGRSVVTSDNDQAASVELRIRGNHATRCAAQRDNSHTHAYALGGRPQDTKPRSESGFALRRVPKPSVARHDLYGMEISRTLSGNVHGVFHRTFSLRRTIDGYEDE
jgi:hypothetical protein